MDIWMLGMLITTVIGVLAIHAPEETIHFMKVLKRRVRILFNKLRRELKRA